MLQSLSLHKKILFGNLLVSFLFLTILTLIIFYSNEHLESQLLDLQVASELTSIKTKLEQSPQLALPRTAQFSVYLDNREESDPLPLFIKNLKIGSHHEIDIDQHTFQVSVEKYKDHKIYILYDITAIEKSHNQLRIIIFSSWFLVFIMMIFLSNRLSYSISKPIQQLSEQVAQINPDKRGLQIDLHFQHVEINNIAHTFNQYLTKMDDYVTKQIAFSAMASHELRSPLTVIQTSADLIGCLSDDPKIQEHVNKITYSTQNMAQLTHALLHVTRDKPIEHDNKPLNIKAIIDQLVENFQIEVQIKNCQIINHIDHQAQVIGDEVLLNVVLSNILKNAIKFNQNSDIHVKFNHHRLEVIDAGSGINNDDIEQFFNFKVKGNNSQGFGIGLYISKLICDQQNWGLEIMQNKNKGITVKIQFS